MVDQNKERGCLSDEDIQNTKTALKAFRQSVADAIESARDKHEARLLRAVEKSIDRTMANIDSLSCELFPRPTKRKRA